MCGHLELKKDLFKESRWDKHVFQQVGREERDNCKSYLNPQFGSYCWNYNSQPNTNGSQKVATETIVQQTRNTTP